jgi:hypothetical protein
MRTAGPRSRPNDLINPSNQIIDALQKSRRFTRRANSELMAAMLQTRIAVGLRPSIVVACALCRGDDANNSSKLPMRPRALRVASPFGHGYRRGQSAHGDIKRNKAES